jgi:hypothetical protein
VTGATDDVVLDVEPEPDPEPEVGFVEAWAGRCTENGVDPATSAAILAHVTGRTAAKARNVPPALYGAAHEAMDAYLAGTLGLVAADA